MFGINFLAEKGEDGLYVFFFYATICSVYFYNKINWINSIQACKY